MFRIRLITQLLKILCAITFIIGLFKIPSQSFDVGSIIYFFSCCIYFLSWRGLSYFYCLINQIINIAIIMSLLLEMAGLLQTGLYKQYFSSSGFYKMGCLIFSIISIYFNFFAYRYFKALALQIYEYQHKEGSIE